MAYSMFLVYDTIILLTQITSVSILFRLILWLLTLYFICVLLLRAVCAKYGY